MTTPAGPPASRAAAELAALALIDHHVHLPITGDLSGDGADGSARGTAGGTVGGTAAFEAYLTESDRPPAAGLTSFDSQLGTAVRRWCAPVLGLDPFPTPARYLGRRAELGAAEATRRFLRATGAAAFLVDTGYGATGDPALLPTQLSEMRELSGADVHEVVRLETVAERVARAGTTAAGFADRFGAALQDEARHAVAVKSVIAYRCGLDFDPAPPSHREVVAAAGAWLREVERGGRARVSDPVLLRHLLWAGVERGLPVQVHTGFGDPDLELHRCDPALMTGFLARVEPHGVPVMLLHCYPYHRSAGYLAQVFPHVFCDVGLAVNHAGTRSAAVVAESLELAPFGKVLYSSDASGPAELHYLGALLWRRAIGRVLGEWVADGDWDDADAARVASMIGRGNARRVYRLD
jgi:predicted TIM-barrel fold metal-dependent hydrolase